MEHEPQLRVLDQGEEAIGAVLSPLHENRTLGRGDLRLDESGALSERSNVVAGRLQLPPVRIPRGFDRLFGVMEQIDVAGDTSTVEELVEGHTPGDVALAGADAPLG